MRPRRTDHHLPPRVYFTYGRFRYFPKGGKPVTLGKEWDRAAREKYDAISRGTAPPQTVSALLDAFLLFREGEVRAGRTSKRTLADNEQEAKVLRLVFGQMPAKAVTSKHIARNLRERRDRDGKAAPVRANRETALLSSAYSWAMGQAEWDVERNPCYGVRRNTEHPRRRYVETLELALWKRHALKWQRAYVLLKRLAGARQGEMLALTLKDMTDKGIRFGISKTGRVKIVRWSWALRVVYASILSLPRKMPCTALFVSRHGTPLTNMGFKSAWARTMAKHVEAGGTSFAEHDLRAKTASDLSIERAQELLDHASPSITRDVYQRAPVRVRPLR